MMMTSALGFAQTKGKPTVTPQQPPVQTEKVVHDYKFYDEKTKQTRDTFELFTLDRRILDQLITGRVDDVQYLYTQDAKHRHHFIDEMSLGRDFENRSDASQNLHIRSIVSVASEDNDISLDEFDSRITVVTSPDRSMGIAFQEAGGVLYVGCYDDADETALAISPRQYGPMMAASDKAEMERQNRPGEKIEGVRAKTKAGDGNNRIVRNTLKVLLGELPPGAMKTTEYMKGLTTSLQRLEAMVRLIGEETRRMNVELARQDITDSVRVNANDLDGTGIIYANDVEGGHVAYKAGDTPAVILRRAQEQGASVTGKQLHGLYKANSNRVADRMQGQNLAFKDKSGQVHIYRTLGCNGSGVQLVMPDEEALDENGNPLLEEVTLSWEDVTKKGIHAINFDMMKNLYSIQDQNAPVNPRSFYDQLGGYALGMEGEDVDADADADAELEGSDVGTDAQDPRYDWMRGNPASSMELGAPAHYWQSKRHNKPVEP